MRDGLTNEELVVACRNIGHDLTCGQCASVFYTGVGTYAHDETCMTGGWGVWKFPRRAGERPLFRGSRDASITWAKEHHADHGQLHVGQLEPQDMTARLRALNALRALL